MCKITLQVNTQIHTYIHVSEGMRMRREEGRRIERERRVVESGELFLFSFRGSEDGVYIFS